MRNGEREGTIGERDSLKDIVDMALVNDCDKEKERKREKGEEQKVTSLFPSNHTRV